VYDLGDSPLDAALVVAAIEVRLNQRPTGGAARAYVPPLNNLAGPSTGSTT
jgi:hypothetical protein